MGRRRYENIKRVKNGVYIQTIDGSLYTKEEYEALSNKPLKSGVYIQTVDGKVYTEDQYKALVPNGVYIQTVDGKLYTKAEWEAYKPADGIYIETIDGSLYTKEQYQALKSYDKPNGVYIQDINRNLYTREEWETLTTKPTPSGIAVISNEASFVVALNDSPNTLKWQTTAGDITDLPSFREAAAKADFNGKSNSDIIAAASNGGANAPANEYCQNFTFPDGDKGYLPALGEWQITYNNKAEINELLVLVGGASVSEEIYWSSSGDNSDFSWSMGFDIGHVSSNYGKLLSFYVRAFTSLPYTKEKQPNGVCVVSGGHIFTIAKEEQSYLKWQEHYSDIVDLIDSTIGNNARKDIGRNSSEIIANAENGGANALANNYCQNYIFPNNKKGYLPPVIELELAYQNKVAVNELLTLIGTAFVDVIYWTANEYNASRSWYFYFSNGQFSYNDKTENYNARAFTETRKYTPKGIAVVTDETRFVIALNEAPSNLKWQTTASDIVNLPNITTESAAKQDFNGKSNSDIIAAASNGGTNAPANDYCQKYTFPDGSKGYLPACGELLTAYNNLTSIQELIVLAGGTIILPVYYWSSTEVSVYNAWYRSFNNLTVEADNKTSSYGVRAFTPLSSESITPNAVVIVDSKTSFKIALEDAPTFLKWQTTLGDIEGFPYVVDGAHVENDFNGKTYSDIIKSSQNGGSNCPANDYCVNYSFNDGSKGFLPSAGQLWLATNNKDSINRILDSIGTKILDGTYNSYWSSSLFDANDAWYAYFRNSGSVVHAGFAKTTAMSVRPFGTFENGDPNLTPNGIVVVENNCAFIIALDDLPNIFQWQTTSGDIANLPNIATSDLAKLDFNGKSNSDIIHAADNGGANSEANEYCRNYIFPNGINGYLPSAGELYVTYQNSFVIDNLLILVGGYPFEPDLYWSSSENDVNNAWAEALDTGDMSAESKDNLYNVRPFGVFNPRVSRHH